MFLYGRGLRCLLAVTANDVSYANESSSNRLLTTHVPVRFPPSYVEWDIGLVLVLGLGFR